MPPLGIASPQIGTSRHNPFGLHNFHHNTTTIKESGRHSPLFSASTRGPPGMRAVPYCSKKRAKAHSTAQLPSQHNSHQRVGPTQPTARREHARPARHEGSPIQFRKALKSPHRSAISTTIHNHQRVGLTQPTAQREHARPARPEGSSRPFPKSTLRLSHSHHNTQPSKSRTDTAHCSTRARAARPA